MKAKSKIGTLAYSVLSSFVLALFIIMGLGSDGLLWEASTVATSEILEDGKRKTTYTTGHEDKNKTIKKFTGEKDTQGRWVGPVVIEKGTQLDEYNGNYIVESIERVNMVDGIRDGTGVITGKYDKPEPNECWDMGKRIDCAKGATFFSDDPKAYELLSYQYPWYIRTLHSFSFDHSFIKGYLDTLELLIFSNDLSAGGFDDYYEDAIDSLAGTAYDTLTVVHSILTIHIGMDEAKNAQFRMAVIDQSRQDVFSTYDMIATKYPGYLQMMNEAEVSNDDFEGFCWAFDSIMNTFAALDPVDPFYVDSVENRMYYALNLLSAEEETTANSGSLKSAKSLAPGARHKLNISSLRMLQNVKEISSSRSAIAEEVFFSMLVYLFNGDKIFEVLDYVYRMQESIVSLAVVTTGFVDHLSPTSVELIGNIIEDGGGEVNAAGIAWSTHHNPTVEDQTETAGTTSGYFTVTLEGLSEGQTYFARTYATNSAGTAYGNNIEFTAKNTTGIAPLANKDLSLRIYPNPAGSVTMLEINLQTPEEVSVLIYDLKGGLVVSPFKGPLPAGENLIELDVSSLQDNVYECTVVVGQSVKLTKILLVNQKY